MHWSKNRRHFLRECGKFISVRFLILFLMFGMLLSFQYVKNYWRSHIVTSWYYMHCKKQATYSFIYLWSSRLLVLNIASKNVRLVTLSYKDFTANHYLAKQWWLVQTNNITKELDIRKHFCVSLFVVAIKINSFTTLACYSIGCTVKICQINGLRRS